MIMQTVSIQATITWKAFRDQESSYWIGICDALKLTAQGQTWTGLLESITETHDMLFQELAEKDELEQFLKDRGWTSDMPVTKKALPRTRFELPFNMQKQKRRYDPEAALC